ncbi:MAG: alanyl-tRNA editing protein [Candidatus Thalassarchaeaceae archaeon]|nr:alanyl-tRNA editing protein [Candidatus Thalassarchaeaceae archaeon]
MQERLHLQNHPGINPQPFSSKVLSIIEDSIILEQSYCYPKGGGQPGDTGTLSGQGISERFTEVHARELIHHPVNDVSTFKIGQVLDCTIDVPRRNSLAITHTAQHIVSAMADELWDATTVGNQLGTEESRIDLLFDDKTKFSQQVIQDKVNEIIGSNRSVTVANWTADEILTDDRVRNRSFVSRILERLPSHVEHMRVVNIEGIDICPCAGSHVDNVSQLTQIEITRIKQKGAGKIRLYYTM